VCLLACTPMEKAKGGRNTFKFTADKDKLKLRLIFLGAFLVRFPSHI